MVRKDASSVLLGMVLLLHVWVVCWGSLDGEAKIHVLTHCCCLQAQKAQVFMGGMCLLVQAGVCVC